MRRSSTILLYVTIAFLLLWQLPWCYNFFVVKPEKTPFTLYSFVIISHRWDRKREKEACVATWQETFIRKLLSTASCLCFTSAS